MSAEKVIHNRIEALAQEVYEEYGVRVDQVKILWDSLGQDIEKSKELFLVKSISIATTT